MGKEHKIMFNSVRNKITWAIRYFYKTAKDFEKYNQNKRGENRMKMVRNKERTN